MNSRKISEIISLYEFTIIASFFSLALVSQNLYLFVLGIFFMGKVLPVRIVKTILKDYSIAKRPENAIDCDTLNKGGPATYSGFPSGHTTATWFLFTYTLLEFNRLKKENRDISRAVIFTGIFAILVPIARSPLGTGCHTSLQVSGGIIFGIIWAQIFYLIEQHLLMLSTVYASSKEKFIRVIESKTL